MVFFERRNPAATWAWLMILLFLPAVGFILYLFLGQNLRRHKTFTLKEEEDRFHRTVLMQEEALEHDNTLFSSPFMRQFYHMIHLHLLSCKALYSQDNEIEVYTDGQEKFKSLMNSLQSATKYIHMQYYIFRNDQIGRKILHILEQKAAQGVEVRLLYDGMGSIALPRNFFNTLKQRGGHTACFFPPFVPYINLRVNYRNHRKITIVDGKEAFIGGFNVGDEYLGKSRRFGFWRDTHIKIKGSAINELQRRFLLDWRFASKKKIEFEEKYFSKVPFQGKTGVQIVASGPDSKWTSVKDGYFKMITTARQKIYIQTPYFVPDESILQALKIAALSGVDVRLMFPCKPDHLFVYWASYSYIGELLPAGIRCYTYNKGFLHSKVMLADGLVASVGTANLDIRSFHLNFEVNAFIYDPEVVQQLEKSFEDDLKECTEITQEIYNQRSLIVKWKESISRLLSPIL
jgi:cardiolipin synthase